MGRAGPQDRFEPLFGERRGAGHTVTALIAAGQEQALAALAERQASAPVHLDNGSLPAGSPMTYYCTSCGHASDVLVR